MPQPRIGARQRKLEHPLIQSHQRLLHNPHRRAHLSQSRALLRKRSFQLLESVLQSRRVVHPARAAKPRRALNAKAMFPRDPAPSAFGCLVVRKANTDFALAAPGEPVALLVPRWECALWKNGVVWVATVSSPFPPSPGELELHRSIFHHAWTALPAKPAA